MYHIGVSLSESWTCGFLGISTQLNTQPNIFVILKYLKSTGRKNKKYINYVRGNLQITNKLTQLTLES